MDKFNLRVYGIFINDRSEILLSKELRFGIQILKFPGGGLEFGEGHKECLKREFLEECNTEIEVDDLFYVNDFQQASAFRSNEQLFSFYYWVRIENPDELATVTLDFIHENEGEELTWQAIETIQEMDMTFPIDRIVLKKLKQMKNS